MTTNTELSERVEQLCIDYQKYVPGSVKPQKMYATLGTMIGWSKYDGDHSKTAYEICIISNEHELRLTTSHRSKRQLDSSIAKFNEGLDALRDVEDVVAMFNRRTVGANLVLQILAGAGLTFVKPGGQRNETVGLIPVNYCGEAINTVKAQLLKV